MRVNKGALRKRRTSRLVGKSQPRQLTCYLRLAALRYSSEMQRFFPNQPTKEEAGEGPQSARRFTTWQSRPAARPANEMPPTIGGPLKEAMQGTRTTMIQRQAATLPI